MLRLFLLMALLIAPGLYFLFDRFPTPRMTALGLSALDLFFDSFSTQLWALDASSYGPVAALPELGLQGLLVICLMVVIIFVLLMEYLPPDIALFFGGILFCLTGIVSFEDFLHGFSTPMLLTLAMLFILMRAMELHGLMDWVAAHLFVNPTQRPLQLLRMCAPIMLLSNFFSNTALALFYTPLVKRWALEHKLYPSEFLIPIAYLSVLGSNMTLMGSAPNLVVQALLENTHAGPLFQFFTISPLGILLALVGLLFMVLAGYRLLPKRAVADNLFHPSYSVTLQLLVSGDSFILGHSLQSLSETYLRGLTILEIRRQEKTIVDPELSSYLQVGDALILFGDVARLLELKRMPGLEFAQDSTHRIEFSSTHYGEAVLGSTSELIGKNLRELEFRKQFGASVVAIYRAGHRIEGDITLSQLKSGDVLFLLSHEPLADKENIARNFFLIRHSSAQPPVSMTRAWLLLGVMIAMVGVAYATSMVYATTLAVLFLFTTGLVDFRQMRKAVRWDLLILLGSGMIYGKVLSSSGVASWIAFQLQPLIGSNPHMLIAMIFLMTMLMAQVITTVACVLIMFPIAVTMMHLAGFEGASSLQAVGAALTIASSTCFLSPLGYQVNMIIYGQGGYRFGDFTRVGLPLAFIVAFISISFIPWWWPLTAAAL